MCSLIYQSTASGVHYCRQVYSMCLMVSTAFITDRRVHDMMERSVSESERAKARSGSRSGGRGAGATYSSMAQLLGLLVPAAGTHFLAASAAPVAAKTRATSAPDVLRRLLLPQSRLASQPNAAVAAASGRQLGAVAILQARPGCQAPLFSLQVSMTSQKNPDLVRNGQKR